MRLIGTYRTDSSWETVATERRELQNGSEQWAVVSQTDPDAPEQIRSETVIARYGTREQAELHAMRKVFTSGGTLGDGRASVMNNRVPISIVKDRWPENEWEYVNSLRGRTRIAFRRITGSELPETF